MASVANQSIEYIGVESCNSSNYQYFKQFNKEQIIKIPAQKPDIEQLVKVWAEAAYLNQTIVRTPVGTSLEGQIMTGYKLFVTGEIKVRYQYVSCYAEQSVHTAEGIVALCEYVVLPSDFCESQEIFSRIVIEDIYSQKIDGRSINNNFTLMLIANLK